MTETLTREAILAMPAGRELDCLVALKVMGWTEDREGDFIDAEGRAHGFDVKYWEEDRDSFEPSTDITAAWRVVDSLFLGWFRVMIWNNANPETSTAGKIWWCEIGTETDGECYRKMFTAAAQTAPLAICRAALLLMLGVA